MATKYNARRQKDNRRVRPEVVVTTIIVVVLILGATLVFIDSLKTDTTIDNSENKATLSYYESKEEPLTLRDERLFTIKLPKSWERVSNYEARVGSGTYFPIRYRGTVDDAIGRVLDIYVNNIPGQLPVTKVLPATVSELGIIRPQVISPQCNTFTEYPEDREGTAYQSKWEDTVFMCDTHSYRNIIAAVEGNLGNGITISNGEHSYKFLFVYTDHGSSPNNNLFNKILETFRLK